jgi:phage host-nuclease inhibitor protein Gam
VKLYQLSEQYALLEELAESGEDVAEELAALTDAIDEKGSALARVLATLKADASALREEEHRLSARRKAIEANAERIRDYLRANMEHCGIHKIRSPAFTITLQTSPERVEVERMDELPPEYVRTKREPDRAAILAAYKLHGECVPGTRIERGMTLVIR